MTCLNNCLRIAGLCHSSTDVVPAISGATKTNHHTLALSFDFISLRTHTAIVLVSKRQLMPRPFLTIGKKNPHFNQSVSEDK